MILTIMFGIVSAIIKYSKNNGWRSMFRSGPTDLEIWEAEVETFWGHPPTVKEPPERCMIDGRSYLRSEVHHKRTISDIGLCLIYIDTITSHNILYACTREI